MSWSPFTYPTKPPITSIAMAKQRMTAKPSHFEKTLLDSITDSSPRLFDFTESATSHRTSKARERRKDPTMRAASSLFIASRFMLWPASLAILSFFSRRDVDVDRVTRDTKPASYLTMAMPIVCQLVDASDCRLTDQPSAVVVSQNGSPEGCYLAASLPGVTLVIAF